jgi:hypothetical protein
VLYGGSVAASTGSTADAARRGGEMQSEDDEDRPEPDPVDEAAAKIDARSPDAPEQIDDLKDLAESLGREVDD